MKDTPKDIADRLKQYSETLYKVASKLGYFCPGSLAAQTLFDLSNNLSRDAAVLSLAVRERKE